MYASAFIRIPNNQFLYHQPAQRAPAKTQRTPSGNDVNSLLDALGVLVVHRLPSPEHSRAACFPPLREIVHARNAEDHAACVRGGRFLPRDEAGLDAMREHIEWVAA